jgi:toxin ParE1/3/4
MRAIQWSFDARSDLVEIVSYIKENSGAKIAKEIYDRIQGKVTKAADYPEGYRVAPELQEIGVFEVREIIESPWRIFFRSSSNELRIISVIDGRRNVEEILYKKMLEGKLKS